MKGQQFTIRLQPDFRAECDQARGSVPLGTWLKGLAEKELERLRKKRLRKAGKATRNGG